MSAAEKWSALIQGGIGPDVWDKEFAFIAADLRDAASLAESEAETLGGHVVELVRNDLGQGHAESLNKERAALAEFRRQIEEAIAPVKDWYQNDEAPKRALADVLKDIVADLQSDRADALKLKRSRAKWERLRKWAHTTPCVLQDIVGEMQLLDAEEKEGK